MKKTCKDCIKKDVCVQIGTFEHLSVVCNNFLDKKNYIKITCKNCELKDTIYCPLLAIDKDVKIINEHTYCSFGNEFERQKNE